MNSFMLILVTEMLAWSTRLFPKKTSKDKLPVGRLTVDCQGGDMFGEEIGIILNIIEIFNPEVFS